MVSVEIGAGTTSDDFSAIDWANGPYFVKTETDPAGGSTYSITGTSQLLSVPYALHAKTADSFLGAIDELDPVFGKSIASGITQADTTLWNANVEETDPVFGASVAMGITGTDTTFWNNKMDADVNAGTDNLMTFDGTNWVAKRSIVVNTGGNLAQNNMQPWLAINYIIALTGVFPSRSSIHDPTIGEITMFGGNFAPRNWAFCSGQLLAISSNQSLFSILGTTYGGDGRTTFALPDLRGRTAIQQGRGPGLSDRRLGHKGGSETNTMSITEMPSHNHTIIYQ